MATLSEILPRKWPGAEWTLTEDNYTTLVWISASPKPTEAEIRAFSAEVDALVAAERTAERHRSLLDRADAVLLAFEVLAAAIDDLQTRLVVTGQVANRIDTLRTRLADIRAQ